MTGERQEVFTVPVDYSQSLGQMIRAGEYDEINSDMNSRNFRLEGAGFREVELTLVQFSRLMAPLELAMLMERRGYRPATIEELLALGKAAGELQKTIPVVALGSGLVRKNRRYVPCLGGTASIRNLTLVVIYRRWSNCYRFLFVKRQQ
jgi:hypothetical protein